MDFYIDIGAAVLLRILHDKPDLKYRRLFLKLFKAIARAYEHDAEFADAVAVMRAK